MMSKQYTPEEEQRIREIFKELEVSFNSWGPLLEELFDIYDAYKDHHITILQKILWIMNDLNCIEKQRRLNKYEVQVPSEDNGGTSC